MIFHISEHGAPQVAAHLEESGALALNIEPALHLVALDMMRVETEIWNSQGRRGGGSWKRLAQSTIDRKGHSEILVESGDLLESVTQPDAKYQILHYTNSGLEFGTDRPWAFVHQYGRLDGSIAARPFIRYTQFDRDRWDRMIAEYILKPFHEGTILQSGESK